MSASRRPVMTPHFALLPYVDEAPATPAARLSLTRALKLASRVGDVDQFGRSSEGMFWITMGKYAEQAGVPQRTLDRALAELRDRLDVLRWRIVHPLQRLPMRDLDSGRIVEGHQAKKACPVFYLDVHAVHRLLRPGTDLASVRQIVVPRSATCSPGTHVNSRTSGSDPRLVRPVNRSLKDLNQNDHRNLRASAGGPEADRDHGLDSNEEKLETVFRAWWEHVGKQHQDKPVGLTCDDVRHEIRARLAGAYTLLDLLDVVRAASDPAVGGALKLRGETPFEWCKRHQVWHAGLFKKTADLLLQSARLHRQTQEERARAAARMAQEASLVPSCGVDRSDGSTDAQKADAWQSPPSVEALQAQLAAALQAGGRKRA